jgi:hypothetical protein
MSEYRLYCLDGAGSISFADWIQADDDEGAVRQARELKSSALKCEVWQGSRLVATLNANDLAGDSDLAPPAAFTPRGGGESPQPTG